MSLSEWQRALVRMVACDHVRSADPKTREILEHPGLSERERLDLHKYCDSPGLAVTRDIQHRWRRLRLRGAAKLTLAALGPEAQAALDQFCTSTALRSMFFTVEAAAFLEAVADIADYGPHVGAIARLERALLLTSDAIDVPVDPDTIRRARQSPHASVVELPCAPEALIAALLHESEWPAVGDPHFVLVAPKLPHRWRPASDDEVSLWSRAAYGLELPAVAPQLRLIVTAMLEAGALVPERS